MNPLRFNHFFLILLVALLATVPTTPAFADPPTFETIPLDEILEFDAGEVCDFPVRLEFAGHLNIQHHFDSEGNPSFDKITFVQWSLTITNLDTGESIFTVGPEPIKVTFNQDGSITDAHMGLILHIVSPGEGLITADVGRIVFLITFEDGEQEETVFEAGIHEMEFFPTFCEVLEE